MNESVARLDIFRSRYSRAIFFGLVGSWSGRVVRRGDEEIASCVAGAGDSPSKLPVSKSAKREVCNYVVLQLRTRRML